MVNTKPKLGQSSELQNNNDVEESCEKRLVLSKAPIPVVIKSKAEEDAICILTAYTLLKINKSQNIVESLCTTIPECKLSLPKNISKSTNEAILINQ